MPGLVVGKFSERALADGFDAAEAENELFFGPHRPGHRNGEEDQRIAWIDFKCKFHAWPKGQKALFVAFLLGADPGR